MVMRKRIKINTLQQKRGRASTRADEVSRGVPGSCLSPAATFPDDTSGAATNDARRAAPRLLS